MRETVIAVTDVAKRFGTKSVLESVTFQVEPGQIFAFLGLNGAGKTTTIRMLLGLERPDSGEIRVLGWDPRRDAMEVRRHVGYLAEDQQMWGWMRVRQLLSFMAPFYPTWDSALAAKFAERLELSLETRIRHLSKGQNVRLGLLLALAHRPRLVILDDPTLGLDPIMRKQFLRDVVLHFQSSGTTVFFSSHLLYEVEPVADVVAILDRGRIVRQSPTETLREEVKRLILPAAYDRPERLPGVLDVRRSGKQVAVAVNDVGPALEKLRSERIEPKVVDLNLDEIFEAYVIGKQDEPQNPSEPGLERVA